MADGMQDLGMEAPEPQLEFGDLAPQAPEPSPICLLYTSDAADEL